MRFNSSTINEEFINDVATKAQESSFFYKLSI